MQVLITGPSSDSGDADEGDVESFDLEALEAKISSGGIGGGGGDEERLSAVEATRALTLTLNLPLFLTPT